MISYKPSVGIGSASGDKNVFLSEKERIKNKLVPRTPPLLPVPGYCSSHRLMPFDYEH